MSVLTDLVHQHIDYNYWAHRRIWDYVMQLNDAQFMKPLDYSQGSIHNQIVHTIWAEDVWLSRILGRDNPVYTATDYPNRAAIRARWDDIEQAMRQTIATMDDDALSRVVTYANSKGQIFEQTVLQILLHLVNHGTDHRAQTLAMMHTLGAETIDQDLIAYLRR